jgi:hypothetical protein
MEIELTQVTKEILSNNKARKELLQAMNGDGPPLIHVGNKIYKYTTINND